MDAISDDNTRIEEYLQLHHIHQLMYWFECHKTNTSDNTPDKYGSLTLPQFKSVLQKVLQTSAFDGQLENLFARLNTSSDGCVDWNDFCTYLLAQLRENDYMSRKKILPFQSEPRIRHILHNRQETTSAVLSVENPTKYITISKEGAVCMWNVSLHEEKCYEVFDFDNRRVREWVTDAVYLGNCHRIAVASTGRDIRFFDIATSAQFCEEFCLYALPNIPCCCSYWFNTQNVNSESIFVYGDDHGEIHLLQFLKPHLQLFALPFNKAEGVQKIYFPELSSHLHHVIYTKLDYCFDEPVRALQYLPECNSVAISTSGSSYSLVIADVRSKNRSYVFSISKGVECFDYNKNLNVLVTGSTDHMVRLWNPYVTSRPVAVLLGHTMSVLAVKIFEGIGQAFSYSRDTVLKAWDIKEQTCIQTIFIKFPISSTVMGRIPEFGPFCMHLIGKTKSLLVTANDYVALLKLGKVTTTVFDEPTTHSMQLCAAIYNQRLKQVVTAADDSCISCWDILTGAKCLQINQAHSSEEITSIVLDGSGKRLVSAARNGTIKIWNIQNGHNLHQLEPVDEQEVTGVVVVDDKRQIIAVGWSRKIIQYNDIHPDTPVIKSNSSWKGGHLHQEDILTVAYCPPNLLATGSFDGDIMIWSLEKETLFKQLKKLPLHRQSASVDSAPVDKLLFLLTRAKNKNPETAILVSSEEGAIRLWNIYGQQSECGHFFVTENSDDSVLGVCTTEDNTLLACGDTHGCISVYNIVDYCMQNASHAKPKLMYSWAAHEAPIVGLDCAENIAGLTFVVSASVDKTAKLWTMTGSPVGTFGQVNPWNLSDPSTWHLSEHSELLSTEDNNKNIETDSDVSCIHSEDLKLTSFTTSSNSDINVTSSKVNLGSKFNKYLNRIKHDREGRRHHLNDIDFSHTNRCKTLCCPFQAVATTTLATITVPSNIEPAYHLIHHGYTSSATEPSSHVAGQTCHNKISSSNHSSVSVLTSQTQGRLLSTKFVLS